MSKKNCLDAILHMTKKLKYFESETLTVEDMEIISKIRHEITRFAGPEDIDVVKIIKQDLNKKYGVESIPRDFDTITPYECIRMMDDRNITAGAMSKDNWIADMKSEIIKEISNEMDAKILKYINGEDEDKDTTPALSKNDIEMLQNKFKLPYGDVELLNSLTKNTMQGIRMSIEEYMEKHYPDGGDTDV